MKWTWLTLPEYAEFFVRDATGQRFRAQVTRPVIGHESILAGGLHKKLGAPKFMLVDGTRLDFDDDLAAFTDRLTGRRYVMDDENG